MAEKMKPEVKAAWVAALRSGEYQQTTGSLHRFKESASERLGFCCLGVLCDVAVKAGVIEPGTVSHVAGTVRYGAQQAGAALPDEVVRWAGFKYEDHDSDPADPYVEWAPPESREPTRQRLSYVNDVGGGTFETIANLIESSL